MALIALGVTGDDAPTELLARLAVGGGELAAALAALAGVAGVREVALLSTCNRTEVCAVADDGAEAAAAAGVADWLEQRGGVSLRPHLWRATGTAVAGHLFAVAAGLRSPVLGDRDVVGQARTAWQAATAAGTAGAELGLLFRHAIVAARRVQRETGLGRPADSVASVVADLVGRRLGDGGGRVLVVGGGVLGAGIATSLHRRGVPDLVIANRTLGRARELAGAVGGRAIGIGLVPTALAEADAVCVAVGPDRPVIDRASAERAMDVRPSRPLLVVDVGMPRGVDPQVSTVAGVRRFDLKDVRRLASRAVPAREADARAAEAIVTEEAARYEEARRSTYAAPVLAALHSWGETVRAEELARLGARLDGLTPEQAAAVDTLTRRLLGKLLHAPSACIRRAASAPYGEWLDDLTQEILTITSSGDAGKAVGT